MDNVDEDRVASMTDDDADDDLVAPGGIAIGSDEDDAVADADADDAVGAAADDDAFPMIP